jgi:hypothetical protein
MNGLGEATEMRSLLAMPTLPFKDGSVPSAIEYESIAPDGTLHRETKPMDGPVEITGRAAVRYRFLWDEKPSAWYNAGVTFRVPC